MIEHDVEDDFDFGFVKGFDHLSELFDGRPWGLVVGIALMRAEESDRRIPPVVAVDGSCFGVDEGWGFQGVIGRDGKKFDGGDAEFLEVLDSTGESCKCARCGTHGGRMHRHALDMTLINDGIGKGISRAVFGIPRHGGGGERDTSRGGMGAVGVAVRAIAQGGMPIVAVKGIVEHVKFPSDGVGKRIDEQLVDVETVPYHRTVRAVHAPSIELAGLEPLDEDVPDIACAMSPGIQRDGLGRHAILFGIKQIEVSGRGVMGVDGEVDPFLGYGGAKWGGAPHHRFVGCHGVVLEMGLAARKWGGERSPMNGIKRQKKSAGIKIPTPTW